MRSSRFAPPTIATAVLLASLLSSPAGGATGSADPSTAQPQFYVLHAEPLGYPLDAVAVHFEYRSGERVVGADDVLLRFDRANAVLVPIPPSFWSLAGATTGADLELLISAEGLLLGRFDRTSLLAYNRTLGYTHAEQVAALSGKPPTGGNVICNSPCGGGCRANEDYDCDGVINGIDNCTDDYNPDQEDCDGDSYGDVCDVIDGNYQPTGVVETCMTDRDYHGYITFEHHVEQRMVDVSSCGAPAFWDRWIRSDADCYGIDDEQCCLNGIGTSIGQVGDNPLYWCGDGVRDVDFCH